MKTLRRVRVPLATSPEQAQSLMSLQVAFARLCNEIAPVVQSTRVWNRVALHHQVYKPLREKYPAVGSQMVCNAIYSVSRTCRLLFQSPQSPFHHTRWTEAGPPRIKFTSGCPVYFDRHTLSLKNGTLSMYTLDGRMKFHVALSEADEALFHQQKLREVVLSRKTDQQFELAFLFGEEGAELTPESPGGKSSQVFSEERPAGTPIPDYVSIEQP